MHPAAHTLVTAYGGYTIELDTNCQECFHLGGYIIHLSQPVWHDLTASEACSGLLSWPRLAHQPEANGVLQHTLVTANGRYTTRNMD